MTPEEQTARSGGMVVLRCAQCGDVDTYSPTCLHPDDTGHLIAVQRERIPVIERSAVEGVVERLIDAGNDLITDTAHNAGVLSGASIETWDAVVNDALAAYRGSS